MVDLSTDGAAAPAADVSLNVAAIGIFVPATASRSLGGGPVGPRCPRPERRLMMRVFYDWVGISPCSTRSAAPHRETSQSSARNRWVWGLFISRWKGPAAAKTGARSLLIENANLDVTGGKRGDRCAMTRRCRPGRSHSCDGLHGDTQWRESLRAPS